MGRFKGGKNSIDKGIYLPCLQCKKIFRVRKFRSETARYCSQSCLAKFNYQFYLKAGFTTKGKVPWNKIYKDKKEKNRVCNKRLLKNNSKYKLSQYFMSYLREKLKVNANSKKILELLGYNFCDLKKHLESKFLPEMSWGNWGRYGWHIDHIRPISSFDYSSINDGEFIKCWSLDNLQPLWAKDNLKKHNKANGRLTPKVSSERRI